MQQPAGNAPSLSDFQLLVPNLSWQIDVSVSHTKINGIIARKGQVW
eukprot:COSAG06_NODE_50242_length_320_cov_0.687783_1_plen_45_part_10